MMDLDIEASKVVTDMLEKRIQELEHKVEVDRIIRKELEEEIVLLKSSSKQRNKIPSHLSSVKQEHLTLLRGYKMRYMARPDGACLTNCLAVHAYEDPNEGERVKKCLNIIGVKGCRRRPYLRVVLIFKIPKFPFTTMYIFMQNYQ